MEAIAIQKGNRPASENKNTLELIEAQLNLKRSSVNPDGLLTAEEKDEATRRSLGAAQIAKYYERTDPEILNRQKRKTLEMVAQFSSDYEQSVK